MAGSARADEWVAGDLHVHTTYSHDSYGGPATTTPGPRAGCTRSGNSAVRRTRVAPASAARFSGRGRPRRTSALSPPPAARSRAMRPGRAYDPVTRPMRAPVGRRASIHRRRRHGGSASLRMLAGRRLRPTLPGRPGVRLRLRPPYRPASAWLPPVSTSRRCRQGSVRRPVEGRPTAARVAATGGSCWRHGVRASGTSSAAPVLAAGPRLRTGLRLVATSGRPGGARRLRSGGRCRDGGGYAPTERPSPVTRASRAPLLAPTGASWMLCSGERSVGDRALLVGGDLQRCSSTVQAARRRHAGLAPRLRPEGKRTLILGLTWRCPPAQVRTPGVGARARLHCACSRSLPDADTGRRPQEHTNGRLTRPFRRARRSR